MFHLPLGNPFAYATSNWYSLYQSLKPDVAMKNAVLPLLFALQFLLGFTESLMAQNAVLCGRIYDAANHEGIRLANVQLLDEDGAMLLSISSGFNGKYQTDSLPQGPYYLVISAEGYAGVKLQAIRITQGTTRIAIGLSKATDAAEAEKKKNKSTEKSVFGLLENVLKVAVAGGI